MAVTDHERPHQEPRELPVGDDVEAFGLDSPVQERPTDDPRTTDAPGTPGDFLSHETGHPPYKVATDDVVLAPELDTVSTAPMVAAARAAVGTQHETFDLNGLDELVGLDNERNIKTAPDKARTEVVDAVPLAPSVAPDVLDDEDDSQSTTEPDAQRTDKAPAGSPTTVADGDEHPPTDLPPTDTGSSEPEKQEPKGIKSWWNRLPLWKKLVGGGVAISAVGASFVGPKVLSPESTDQVGTGPVAGASGESPNTTTESNVNVSLPDTENPATTSPRETTPLTQPPGHLPISESMKDAQPRDVISGPSVGNFYMSMSLADIATFGYDTSQLCEGKKDVYSIPDGDRRVVVGINEETGVVDGIHLEDTETATEAGVHVGSSEADVKKAYGSDVTEKTFTVGEAKIRALVFEGDKRSGSQTLFTLDTKGNVASIDLLDILGSDRATTGPLIVPASCLQN